MANQEGTTESEWRKLIGEEVRQALKEHHDSHQSSSSQSQEHPKEIRCIGCHKSIPIDEYPDHRFSEGIKSRDVKIAALESEVEALKPKPAETPLKDPCPGCHKHELELADEGLFSNTYRCKGENCGHEVVRDKNGNNIEEED